MDSIKSSRHVDLVKVKRDMNPADALTKYVTAETMNKMLRIMNLKFHEGRSKIAPELPPEERSQAALGSQDGTSQRTSWNELAGAEGTSHTISSTCLRRAAET